MERVLEITDRILTPISLIMMVIGGIGYVTWVAYQGNANAQSIERIEKKADAIQEIKVDIAVIKDKVLYLESRSKKEDE